MITLKSYNRNYLNANQEEATIIYPNCMIATPQRLGTSLYLDIYNVLNNNGILKGCYLTINQSNNNNVLRLMAGLLLTRRKIIYVPQDTFTVSRTAIQTTFINTNTLYLVVSVNDNAVNDPVSQNYNPVNILITDSQMTSSSDSDLRVTIWKLNKTIDGILSVDYSTSYLIPL